MGDIILDRLTRIEAILDGMIADEERRKADREAHADNRARRFRILQGGRK